MKKILFLLLCTVSMYGQIPTTGQEQEFDYGIRNNVSPTDDNAPYFTVQNSDNVLGKSTSSVWAKRIYVDNATAEKADLSTGLIKNGLVTTNADPTKFNVTAGIGVISNFDDPENPVVTLVSFPAFTGVTPTYLLTGNITYVAVNSVPALVMQATQFTPEQRRDLIILGAVIHSNLTTINLVNNISAPTNAGVNQLHDLMEVIGALNVTGNKYTANGANLSLDKSAGEIFKLGVNFANDWKHPHDLDLSLQTLLTFRYRTQNGTEGADRTTIDPSVYDLSNVLTAVPVNKFSIQTVTLFQTGATRIQYGQNVYNTLAEAEAAILTRAFVVENNIAMNGITRAYIIVRNNATDLTNATTSKIIEAQKFGGVVSGGVALTDAAIIAALGYTPANDVDVVKTTGTTTSGTVPVLSGTKTITNSTITTSPTDTAIKSTGNKILRLVDVNNVDRLSFGDIGAMTGTALKVIGESRAQDVELALVQNGATLRNYGGYFNLDNTTSNLTWWNRTDNADKKVFTFYNASEQAEFTKALSAGGRIFSTGGTQSGNIASSSGSLEMFYNAGESQIQSYNYTTATALPLNISASKTVFTSPVEINANVSTQFKMTGGLQAQLYLEKTGTNGITMYTNASGFLGFYSVNSGADIFSITNGALKISVTPTTSAGTYDFLTRNTSTGVVEKLASNTIATKALTVRKISTNTTLADTDNGTIILLTASCTVTLPNGLMSGFNCSFSTQTGATMTYALGGSVTLINNIGTTMAQNLSHTIVNTGTANEYLTAGSL